ncbi:TetR/AcrR family transcriptional regulator [Subtercola sp. YIM 133946]|uniref:TetR/AcrR family transcriptional regulator n=1 Tax=Subtercola sp. YIM 133946 TaxID=3118909 RepID=UPI002F93803E
MKEPTAPSVATADRLLVAAAALFREKGFAATSTRELSERLGIVKASLYHHIKSKDDLLLRISMLSLERIRLAAVAAIEAAPPGETLRAVIAAHLETALTDRDMHATMLAELHSLTPERRATVLAERDAYEAVLRSVIAAEQQAGQLRTDLDARELTLGLLNLLNWTIFWYSPEGPQTPADIARFLTTIYLDGATARPAPTP